jgi:hypothetical protein
LIAELPWDEARSGNKRTVTMYDTSGRLNEIDPANRAFQVGNTITFLRPWLPHEQNKLIETDIIREIPLLHICDDTCPPNCPKAYEDRSVFEDVLEPLWVVFFTAAMRAPFDKSVADMQQICIDQAKTLMSSMRESDSAHNVTDTYETAPLGHVSVF